MIVMPESRLVIMKCFGKVSNVFLFLTKRFCKWKLISVWFSYENTFHPSQHKLLHYAYSCTHLPWWLFGLCSFKRSLKNHLIMYIYKQTDSSNASHVPVYTYFSTRKIVIKTFSSIFYVLDVLSIMMLFSKEECKWCCNLNL